MRSTFSSVPQAALPLLMLAAACSSAPDESTGSSASNVLSSAPISMPCGALCQNIDPYVPGDINGDRKSDIVAPNNVSPTGLGVQLSNGNGSFTYALANLTGDTAFPTYVSQGNPRVLSGDFNGDRASDALLIGGIQPSGQPWGTIPVAFAERGPTYNGVNSAGGNNAALTQLVSNFPGTQVVVSDMNNDGKQDLVIVNMVGVTYAISNGDGTFTQVAITNAGSMPVWAATPGAQLLGGDFNGDGWGDFALVGGQGWTSVPVAFGGSGYTLTVDNVTNGAGLFSAAAAEEGAVAVTGDFNGDGKTDIALSEGVGWATVPVAMSNGDGTFKYTNDGLSSFPLWATSLAMGTAYWRGPWFVTGDFNGDGKTDIALTGAGQETAATAWSTIPVAMSNGDGSFAAPTNDTVGAVFEAEQTIGGFALSGDSASSTVGLCSDISNVSVVRTMGSEATVTYTSSGTFVARVGALRMPFNSFPETTNPGESQIVQVFPGTHTVTLTGLENITEYWIQVVPAPLPWTNGATTCTASPVDLPANPCGDEFEACCAGSCNDASQMCVPAGFGGSQTVDPYCRTRGTAGGPCTAIGTCDTQPWGVTCETQPNSFGIPECVAGNPPSSSSGGGSSSSGGSSGCTVSSPSVALSISHLSCEHDDSDFPVTLEFSNSNCASGTATITAQLFDSGHNSVWSDQFTASIGPSATLSFDLDVPQQQAGDYDFQVTTSTSSFTGGSTEIDVEGDCAAQKPHTSEDARR